MPIIRAGGLAAMGLYFHLIIRFYDVIYKHGYVRSKLSFNPVICN